MNQVYQSDAYEVLPGVLINRGKGRLFQGNREKSQILRGKRRYSELGNIRKQIVDFGEQGTSQFISEEQRRNASAVQVTCGEK